MKLIIASNNAHKLVEMKAILGQYFEEILSLREAGIDHETIEDGETFREITPPDYVEGPCMMKRDGKYYFMWSSGGWGNGTYRVNTAIADTPWGPFDNCHTILSTGDSTIANGPGHNGFLYLPEHDQYLMVYHRHKPDIRDGNARFLCIDRMDLDENGNIIPVVMTEEWEYDE